MGFREIVSNHFGNDYKDFELWLANNQGIGSNRLIKACHTVTTDGGGTSAEIRDDAGETLGDRGGTGITLVLASDTNDNAYDTKYVTVKYISTLGEQKTCKAIFNTADSRTEVAFTDLATGLIPVTDFAMVDTPHYGTLAVVSNIAVQAGDNVCIGATGCVAGIADPDICFVIILAGATSPTIANMWGIGSISGDEAANQADADYVWYEEYVTIWGEIKTGSWTFPADSSASTRFVSVTDMATYAKNNNGTALTLYVNDYYRSRDSAMVNDSGVSATAIDECRLGDWDAAAFYNAIEIGQSQACFTRHFVARAADVARTYLLGIRANYQGAAAEYATITLTFNQYGQTGVTTFTQRLYGGSFTIWLPFYVRLQPCTEVKVVVADDGAAGGDFTLQMDLLEAF